MNTGHQNPHALDYSQDELTSVFNAKVLPILQHAPSVKFPRIVILGGQPGAGKSSSSQKIENALVEAGGTPVMIDRDDMRRLHPRYNAIRSFPTKEMPNHTAKISKDLQVMLLRAAFEKACNIIAEGTIRTTDDVMQIVADAEQHNFEVDLHALAVNGKSSTLGIYNRYEDLYDAVTLDPTKPIARWVPISYHDGVYRVFPNNIEEIERTGRIANCVVHQRSGNVIYTNQDANSAASAKTIQQERARIWTPNEREEHANRWDNVWARMQTRTNKNEDKDPEVALAAIFRDESHRLARSTPLEAANPQTDVAWVKTTPYHRFYRDLRTGQLFDTPRVR